VVHEQTNQGDGLVKLPAPLVGKHPTLLVKLPRPLRHALDLRIAGLLGRPAQQRAASVEIPATDRLERLGLELLQRPRRRRNRVRTRRR